MQARKVARNEDKGRWRGRRERCILADYRYRRYAPRYRLGCLECLLVSGRIWYSDITGTRSAQAYATPSERGKIRRRRRQPDDEEDEEEEEEEGRPLRAAAEPIPSDSLFIFRRAYLRLTLCFVVHRAPRLTLFTSFSHNHLREGDAVDSSTPILDVFGPFATLKSA